MQLFTEPVLSWYSALFITNTLKKKNNMKKSFEETVKAMNGYEIVRAMIRGLESAHVAVDFGTYGEIKKIDGKRVCYGCAATNAVCEIANLNPDAEALDLWSFFRSDQAKLIEADFDFLHAFESAIDSLRCAQFKEYNHLASEYGFANLPIPNFYPPELFNGNYLSDLHYYKTYANSIKPKYYHWKKLWSNIKNYFNS